jgi:hypothetical protein
VEDITKAVWNRRWTLMALMKIQNQKGSESKKPIISKMYFGKSI